MPYDRTAQRKAVDDAYTVFKSLQDQSDAAADAAGANRDAIPKATADYNNAVQAYNSRTGTGAAVDSTQAALVALQGKDGVLTTAATNAFVKSNTAWSVLNQAVGALLVNPGAQEVV